MNRLELTEALLAIEEQDEAEVFKDLAKLGFRLVGRVDRVLVNVELPEGWRTERSREDAQTTDILDGANRRRGFSWLNRVTYYTGYSSLTRRLGVRMDSRVDATPYSIQPVCVVDQRLSYPEIGVIQRFEATKEEILARKAAIDRRRRRESLRSWEEMRRADEEYSATADVVSLRAVAWLAEHYPDWSSSPAAYWDAELQIIDQYRDETF
jgi:hypothetical protein